MKLKNIIKLSILLVAIVMFIPVSKAEKCDYTKRAEYSKIAKNVTASYEIKEEDGISYFEFTIYNIVDGIYVSVVEGSTKSTKAKDIPFRDVFASDTDEHNNYVFRVYDTSNVTKYSFRVGDIGTGCSSFIRTFSLVKPRYNEYSELEECSFAGVEDYLYCQKWVTTDFNLTYDGVLEKIRNQRQKSMSGVTTKCLSCEENERIKARNERFYKIRTYFIIGLSCGIVVDLILIVFLFIKTKRDII